jgi:hypothetical protein
VRFPCTLLRTHVGRRPDRDTRGRQLLPAGHYDRPRDPEICHHHLVALKQNVLRLDVAMHHVVAVGITQGAGDLRHDGQSVIDRELVLLVQPIA